MTLTNSTFVFKGIFSMILYIMKLSLIHAYNNHLFKINNN